MKITRLIRGKSFADGDQALDDDDWVNLEILGSGFCIGRCPL